MGGIENMLNVARGAISAHSDAVRVRGDNIANVNTPGYTRRRVNIVTQRSSGVA